MARDFLGIGWAFPVGVDLDGAIKMSRYEADIKEAIRIILETAKGERVMRPDFGCGIHELVFETLNTTTLNQVETSVREALFQYEPRIEIIQVAVSRDKVEEGMLLVNIDYRVRTTNSRDNFVFPFYLKEV